MVRPSTSTAYNPLLTSYILGIVFSHLWLVLFLKLHLSLSDDNICFGIGNIKCVDEIFSRATAPLIAVFHRFLRLGDFEKLYSGITLVIDICEATSRQFS